MDNDGVTCALATLTAGQILRLQFAAGPPVAGGRNVFCRTSGKGVSSNPLFRVLFPVNYSLPAIARAELRGRRRPAADRMSE